MKKSIFWAAVLILVASLLLADAILGAMGIAFFEKLSLGKCFLGVILAATFLNGLFNLYAGRFFLSAAFLFMLFEKEIAQYAGMKSSNILSNWLVFFCAVLLAIGFSVLLSRVREKRKHRKWMRYGAKRMHNHLHNTIRYADSTTPKHVFENEMGNLDVYFDNVAQYQGNAEVLVTNHMGRIGIHVPADWCIECSVNNHTGQVSAKRGNPEGKKIYITGTNHIGQVVVDLIE
ncbi:MAG: hypothetical protein E7616_06260 [Ruminococcaceae bacterium]|nr:hypothetical protein [Oscillospiraceae bacterium]